MFAEIIKEEGISFDGLIPFLYYTRHVKSLKNNYF